MRSDLAELHRLYEEHAVYLRAVIARVAGPRLEADDLLQETFLVAWKKREIFRAGVPARAWLRGVAIRTVGAARRRARIRRTFGLDEVAEVAGGTTPAEAFERREESDEVYRLLDKLNEKKRLVFILHE